MRLLVPSISAWLASSQLVATTAAAAAAAAAVASRGDFSRTCSNVQLADNFFLRASCCRPPAETTSSSSSLSAQSQNELDLDMCIGLNQVTGRLQWEVYGKFSNYCSNCTLFGVPRGGGSEHVLLACSCAPLVGGRGAAYSTLDLDEGIINDMGTLKCPGGIASAAAAGGRGSGGRRPGA